MTEDDVTRGMTQTNILTGAAFDPSHRQSTSSRCWPRSQPASAGAPELWKLNHYYERLDDWYAAQGVAPNPFLGPAAAPDWELHNLTVDPEERHNRALEDPATASTMRSVLDAERDAKRRIPKLRNAAR